MSRGVQYVVLCEDLQTQVFIRRALIRRGAHARRILLVDLPSDSEGGAGDSYVIKHYPKHVGAHRSQAARTQAALIVHTDADPKNSVIARMDQLKDTLVNAGMASRGADERIAHLVPKRNIETWIHFYLDGPPIDEEKPYAKYTDHESDCWPAAEHFSDNAASSAVPTDAPPSLSVGLSEFRRVL